MTIAEQHRICGRNIFVNKRVLAGFARGFLCVHVQEFMLKYICTSKDCPESANLNTWNSFDFHPSSRKAQFRGEREKGTIDLGFVDP